MVDTTRVPLTRRALCAGLAAGAVLPTLGASAQAPDPLVLTAAPGRSRVRPEPAPETEVWTFEGRGPAPILRARLGEEVRLLLRNRTDKPLSLHWHGLRGPNAMDGVAGLTQEPVRPGAEFLYRMTPPDPGTFLGRPLVLGGSGEPAERGLSALLVVEEREPPPVDHDVGLIIDDWRVDEAGAFAPFGVVLEAATAGRLGGVLTAGGRRIPERIAVAPGSRVRLRLANACNARIMRIRFDDLRPYVAAIDSQPTDKFEPLRSTLPFAPGTRYDLLIDMPETAGATGQVTALLGPGLPLVTFVTEGAPRPPRPALAGLPENAALPQQIRLQDAVRREITIAGGTQRGADGQPAYAGNPKAVWTLNGVSGTPGIAPLASIRRGQPVVLTFANATPFPQPLHLHGHVFRLLHNLDDGWEPYWLDTAQIPEGRTARLAFVADNPGRWLIGSTNLERLDTGLWSWIEVT